VETRTLAAGGLLGLGIEASLRQQILQPLTAHQGREVEREAGQEESPRDNPPDFLKFDRIFFLGHKRMVRKMRKGETIKAWP